MGIRRGSISTPIIADGLVFNVDAANRASYPAQRTLATAESGSCYNTLDLSISGSFISDPQFITQPVSASCWQFDGIDDYVDIIDSAIAPAIFQNIGDNNSYSISAWIKTTGGAGAVDPAWEYWKSYITIFELRQQLTTNCTIPFNLGVTSNKLTFGRTSDYVTDYDLVSSTTNVNDGDWHHVAIVIVDDAYTFYLDGAADGTGVFASSTGDCSVGGSIVSNMQIGVRARDGGQKDHEFFNGEIANIQTYNRAISANEVLHNYNALKSRFGL